MALVCSSVIAFLSIEDTKKENEAAKQRIEELNTSIDALQTELEKAHAEASSQEELLKKHQEIFDAWRKATPEVNEAVNRITDAYSVVVEQAHLFPQDSLKQLEDEVMDAIYGAIRSTDPHSIAQEFEKTIAELEKTRYDNIIKSMIEKIKQDGVTFPEDTKSVEEVRKYYDELVNNAQIFESFKEQGIDAEIATLEALLDADEENDLAKAFEDAVASIKTPITLKTSLAAANAAWNTLYSHLESGDTLKDSTTKARILLDTYTERIDQLNLAKAEADLINSDISALKIAPDLTCRNEIASLEQRISSWKEKFNIDEANLYLVNDISTVKKSYENALAELRKLYEAFKAAVESIGNVNVNSKAAIDNAFAAFNNIKGYKDADAVLSLTSPNTVGELYTVLEAAYNSYNYLVSLLEAIRAEIDRMHTADPDVTYAEADALKSMADELISLGATLDALDTDTTNYVNLYREACLLPYKNDAFKEIKTAYDEHYAKANDNRDIILSLVVIKDAALHSVENAGNIDEICAAVEKAKIDFSTCLN